MFPDHIQKLISFGKVPFQLVRSQIEVSDSYARGVPNEIEKLHFEELGSLANGNLVFTIEFENNKLSGSFFKGTIKLP